MSLHEDNDIDLTKHDDLDHDLTVDDRLYRDIWDRLKKKLKQT
jgi:hypothetical protein